MTLNEGLHVFISKIKDKTGNTEVGLYLFLLDFSLFL